MCGYSFQLRHRSLPIAHEIPRRSQGLYPLRRRRQRLRRVPAREVHRVRRPERRRRRPRRRRDRAGGRRPQHADRLPLRSSTSRPRRASAAWARTATAPSGDDIVLKVPVGTQIFEEDKETLLADLDRRPATRGHAGKGGNGGFGNAHFKSLDQPRAAQRQSGPARRGALDLAAPEADRRRRPGRPAERRQVDLPRRGERGAARRSPTIRSPRSIRSSAWSRPTTSRSCSPTFPA